MIKINNLEAQIDDFNTDYTLQIKSHELSAIIGKSGAGKSTLLNLIAGFNKSRHGSIYINDINITNTPPSERPISSLFQENNLFSHLNVQDNIALAINPNLKLNTKELDELRQSLLAVGMSKKIKSMTNVLSGGERQRVALARSIVSKKDILLLDEPLSQLDPHLRKDMLKLIKKIKEERNLTVIMVVHTPEEVVEYVDNFIQIDKGKVIKIIKPEELDISNIY